MKIKKDWFGMFSSTREYARSIYVREPTEEVEKRIWTKRIKTAGVLMAALLLSFLYCLFQPSDTQEILDGYVVRRQEQESKEILIFRLLHSSIKKLTSSGSFE